MTRPSAAQRRLDHERLSAVVSLAIEAGRITNQTSLATRTGVTPQALSNMLAGRRGSTSDVHRKLAQALGVPLMLITTAEDMTPAVAQLKADEAKAVAKKRAAVRSVAKKLVAA